jgi:hypothetical protein
MKKREHLKTVDILIIILILGSLWGLSEVIVNGIIQQTGIPYRSGILIGVGMGLMGIFVGIFKRFSFLIGIALVAILCKQLVVPILGVSIMCKANSCLAVIIDSLALTGAAVLVGHKMYKKPKYRIIGGLAAGLSAGVVFYFVGMKTAPCPSLLTFAGLQGFGLFLLNKCLVWMVFSGIFFPVGYILGNRLKDIVFVIRIKKPLFYYASSVTLIVCCWLAVAFAIAAGY